MSDEELFETARKILLNEYLGLSFNIKKRDEIFELCQNRNKSIFDSADEKAIEQSEKILSKLKNSEDFFTFTPSSITDDEIEKLIFPVTDKITESYFADNENNPLKSILRSDVKNLIAYTVHGDSMIDANLIEGDIVYADKTIAPSDGDIVLAIVLDQAFIKRYREIDGNIILESANVKYKPIKIEPYMEFEVIGVVALKTI